MPPKKLRRSESPDRNICVIHFKDIDHDKQTFTPLTEERLSKLKCLKEKRLAQPPESKHRMADICAQIPEKSDETMGYHRDCYKRFASHAPSLPSSTTVEETDAPRPSRCSSNESEKYIFNANCIFCKKPGPKAIKRRGTWTTELTTTFDYGGGETIKEIAEEKKDFDLLRRIKGYDLFACEAQYHRSCRLDYVRDPASWQSNDEITKTEQAELDLAHKRAFAVTCAIVEEKVIAQKSVIQLEELRKAYIDELDQTSHPNPMYRSEKLKAKLLETEELSIKQQKGQA